MKTIISVIGADIYKDAEGVWRTNDLNVRYGATNSITDSFRVPAAAQYVADHAGEDLLVFPQGGLQNETYPSIASVMRRELVELGVPGGIIDPEEETQATRPQLLKLQAKAQEPGVGAAHVISNEWHRPRIEAMIECAPGLEFLRALKPTFVAAEGVLLAADPEYWREKIEASRKREDVKVVTALELSGAAQVRNGMYVYKDLKV